MNADQYVQPFNDRWIVAVYRPDSGRYYAPLRNDVRRVSGCFGIEGSLEWIHDVAYSYARRSDALRRVRKLFYY